MSAPLLLVHGDDGFGLDAAVRAFAAEIDATEHGRGQCRSARPTSALERAALEAGTMSMFGAHLTVLRQPLKAAGRSSAAAERLLALVRDLLDGSALALVEERPSRDYHQAAGPAQAPGGRGARARRPGRGARGPAPRRAARLDHRPCGADRDADRGPRGACPGRAHRRPIWETDVERGEMTRIADSELRKLATYAGDQPITVDDVEALTADTRPASVFAITNAIDRREPAAAAEALRRALAEGQPGLRILASLPGG